MKKDIKILIIGDDCGPKSQLMKNYFNYELTATAGPSFQHVMFESGEMRYSIWSIEYKDIEKNFPTVPMYFKDAEHIIVISKEQKEQDNILQRLKTVQTSGKLTILEQQDFEHFFELINHQTNGQMSPRNSN